MTRFRRSATWRTRFRRRFVIEPLETRIALSDTGQPYDIGAPTFTNLWVDPLHGNDSNTGTARDQALQSLKAAWALIPTQGSLSSTGYRILLTAGDYASSLLPDNGWMSGVTGTASCPVLIESVDGPLAARLHGNLDAQQDSYLYLVGLNFITDPGTEGGGDVLQIASDDHVLIRDCSLSGFDGTTFQTQETLKANQCQYVYVEGSDISGSYWFPLDFVAVQYGHILGCKIHDSGDDGLVLKGGSAQILVQGNEVYNIATIGITAGQGTGFEFMVAPWIQYEAYDIQIVGNDIHDVQNAGLAVQGGTDIVMTDNMLYRVGLDQNSGSAMLLIALGDRSCDGDAAACQALHDLGGWGPTQPGVSGEWIPNHDVSVTNNVFLNPAGSATLYDTITIAGPADPPPDTNIPSPALADDGLNISGNVFWNGGADHNLGVNDPVRAAQLQRDNQIGTIEPALNPPPLGVGDPVLPPITSTPTSPVPIPPPYASPPPPNQTTKHHRKQLGHQSQGEHGQNTPRSKPSPKQHMKRSKSHTLAPPLKRAAGTTRKQLMKRLKRQR